MFLQDGAASHDENMQYVNLAVRACVQRRRGLCHRDLNQDMRDTRPVKRDSRGQIRKSNDSVRDSVPFSVPFGPHLSPVLCQQESSPETSTKDLEFSSDAAQRTKLTSAVQLHRGEYECSPDLTQCRPCDRADEWSGNSSEDYEDPAHAPITTNDLLDCLVHPDVIACVTKLLLERHTGNHRTSAPSQL